MVTTYFAAAKIAPLNMLALSARLSLRRKERKSDDNQLSRSEELG
jgi:hypothetical protein